MLPTRTLLAATLVAAAVLLAPLVTPTSATTDTPTIELAAEATTSTDTLPWSLLDCEYVVAQVATNAQNVQPYLPDGFVAKTQEPAGVARETGGTAIIGFEVDVCQSGAGLHGDVSPMTYASTWVAVTPPRDLAIRGDGAWAYYVNFDFLAPDEDRRALFQSRGLPAGTGVIDIQRAVPQLPGGPTTVHYEIGGNGAFHMTFTSEPSGAVPLVGRFAQFTQGDNGLARWRTDYAATANHVGAGIIELSADSWQAQMLGGTTHPARYLSGTWDYTNGLIELPPA